MLWRAWQFGFDSLVVEGDLRNISWELEMEVSNLSSIGKSYYGGVRWRTSWGRYSSLGFKNRGTKLLMLSR